MAESLLDTDMIKSLPVGLGEEQLGLSSPAPHTLSILGLTYITKNVEGHWYKLCFRPKRYKAILKNISLHVQSGEVTAILGNSGSGKTTLLDIISCRAPGQVVGGVYLDGALMTSQLFRSQAGYVIQADRLLPNLTVRETLTYVAELKFSLASKAAIKFQVEQVLIDLGIRHVADSRVGSMLVRGISGGEKRRVSIAVQLLQDPKVLLLDEPTTGLDSFTAHDLVETLSALAKRRNKIILMSIHQPRSDIYRLFDNVGLLSRGEMVYLGPAQQLVPHFTDLGYTCPKYANPLDHYLDVVSVDYRSAEKEQTTMVKVEQLKVGYFHSQIFRDTLADIHATCHFPDRYVLFDGNPLGVPAPPGYMMALGTLVTRTTVNFCRDILNFITRLTYLSIFSVLMYMFLGGLQNNLHSIQDRVGLFFQSGQTAAYCGLIMGIAIFPPLRELYYREHRDGLYSPLVFLNSYFVFVIPFALGCSFLFSTINYWALELYPDPARYGLYFTVSFLMHYGGELLGVLFMGIFKDVNVANSITALVLAITGMLSSGFLRSIQSMPKAIAILSYGTIFKYSSEIYMANEFHQLPLECPGLNNSEKCTGDVILDIMYPGSVDNMARNFGIVGSFVWGYAVLAIITYRIIGIKQTY